MYRMGVFGARKARREHEKHERGAAGSWRRRWDSARSADVVLAMKRKFAMHTCEKHPWAERAVVQEGKGKGVASRISWR